LSRNRSSLELVQKQIELVFRDALAAPAALAYLRHQQLQLAIARHQLRDQREHLFRPTTSEQLAKHIEHFAAKLLTAGGYWHARDRASAGGDVNGKVAVAKR
jgi:hypothetical protein